MDLSNPTLSLTAEEDQALQTDTANLVTKVYDIITSAAGHLAQQAPNIAIKIFAGIVGSFLGKSSVRLFICGLAVNAMHLNPEQVPAAEPAPTAGE